MSKSDIVIDESCYYCKYNLYPEHIRDFNKNMCSKINNKGWNSEQIRNCPHRDKNHYFRKNFFDYLFDWVYYGTNDYFIDMVRYIFRRI